MPYWVEHFPFLPKLIKLDSKIGDEDLIIHLPHGFVEIFEHNQPTPTVKAVWAQNESLLAENADYCKFINEWPWLRSLVYMCVL